LIGFLVAILFFQTFETNPTIQTASALTCIEDTLEDEFNRSDLVFFGIVDSKEYEADPTSSIMYAKVTFKVLESYKGFENAILAGDKITIFSYEDPGWGFEYEISEKMMILAYYVMDEGFKVDQLCTRTGYNPSDEMLAELESLKQHNIFLETLPDWVRNIFIWYGEDKISEKELMGALHFLIKEGIIKV